VCRQRVLPLPGRRAARAARRRERRAFVRFQSPVAGSLSARLLASLAHLQSRPPAAMTTAARLAALEEEYAAREAAGEYVEENDVTGAERRLHARLLAQFDVKVKKGKGDAAPETAVHILKNPLYKDFI